MKSLITLHICLLFLANSTIAQLKEKSSINNFIFYIQDSVDFNENSEHVLNRIFDSIPNNEKSILFPLNPSSPFYLVGSNAMIDSLSYNEFKWESVSDYSFNTLYQLNNLFFPEYLLIPPSLDCLHSTVPLYLMNSRQNLKI